MPAMRRASLVMCIGLAVYVIVAALLLAVSAKVLAIPLFRDTCAGAIIWIVVLGIPTVPAAEVMRSVLDATVPRRRRR